MNIDELSHPVVRAALTAINANDRKTWFSLFAPNATLTDDGNRRTVAEWSDAELFGKGNGRISRVDSEEAGGLTVNAVFHSAVWGEFMTFWKFEVQGDQITRLDVGQISA